MRAGIVVAWIVFASLARAAVSIPTARQAVDIAKSRVPPSSQDLVLRIEGVRSDAELRPREWRVTFYDDSRVNNALTVKVEDGRDTKVETVLRMFEDGTWRHFDRNFTGFSRNEAINLSRWKIDSDEAVSRALKQRRISEVQVTEVRLWLRKLSDGDVPPVWRVHLRARSKTHPSREASIGYIDLSAESGEVLRNETRVGKLLD
jgi:hypothetical protein